MRIFIGWGGATGERLAEALNNWFPLALQYVEPFVSPNLEKSVAYAEELAKKIRDSDLGIFCLTREGVHRPWPIFEAGIVSRGEVHQRVYPLLFDLKKGEQPSPWSIFQGTQFEETDFFRMLGNINDSGKERLNPVILKKAFDVTWPVLKESVDIILKTPTEVTPIIVPDDQAIHLEMLDLLRQLAIRNPIQAGLDYDIMIGVLGFLEEVAAQAEPSERNLVEKVLAGVSIRVNNSLMSAHNLNASDAMDRFERTRFHLYKKWHYQHPPPPPESQDENPK